METSEIKTVEVREGNAASTAEGDDSKPSSEASTTAQVPADKTLPERSRAVTQGSAKLKCAKQHKGKTKQRQADEADNSSGISNDDEHSSSDSDIHVHVTGAGKKSRATKQANMPQKSKKKGNLKGLKGTAKMLVDNVSGTDSDTTDSEANGSDGALGSAQGQQEILRQLKLMDSKSSRSSSIYSSRSSNRRLRMRSILPPSALSASRLQHRYLPDSPILSDYNLVGVA